MRHPLKSAGRSTGAHLENGVQIVDERHTYIDWDVSIGEGSIIHPHNFIYGDTKIGRSVLIAPHCTIENCDIQNHAHIKAHCHLERAVVGERCAIGPFAHLRPESRIGENAKIGNFVEVKKIHPPAGGQSQPSLLYRDAQIGEQSNIGCGFITL